MPALHIFLCPIRVVLLHRRRDLTCLWLPMQVFQLEPGRYGQRIHQGCRFGAQRTRWSAWNHLINFWGGRYRLPAICLTVRQSGNVSRGLAWGRRLEVSPSRTTPSHALAHPAVPSSASFKLSFRLLCHDQKVLDMKDEQNWKGVIYREAIPWVYAVSQCSISIAGGWMLGMRRSWTHGARRGLRRRLSSTLQLLSRACPHQKKTVIRIARETGGRATPGRQLPGAWGRRILWRMLRAHSRRGRSSWTLPRHSRCASLAAMRPS